MTLANEEIESLRFHLGHGNIGAAAQPYTPDGFLELFTGVIAPNLTAGYETTSATTVAVGAATMVVAAATGIAQYGRLVVDVGDAAEVVVVRNVSGTSVTCAFAKAHTGTFPVATMCGIARARILLHTADKAWASLQGDDIATSAGIRQVDEILFFGGREVSRGRVAHYMQIVTQLSQLCRVPSAWESGGGGGATVEIY